MIPKRRTIFQVLAMGVPLVQVPLINRYFNRGVETYAAGGRYDKIASVFDQRGRLVHIRALECVRQVDSGALPDTA